MTSIEEFRASLTAKRDLAGRMAATAGRERSLSEHEYHRGRQHAFEQARKMLDDVDLAPALPDGWEPPPNLEREVTNGEVQAVLRQRGLSANLYTEEASAVRDELERANKPEFPGRSVDRHVVFNKTTGAYPARPDLDWVEYVGPVKPTDAKPPDFWIVTGGVTKVEVID